MTDLTIVIPDVHAPFHHTGWWETTKELIEGAQPRRIVCTGDFVDCYSVTMHVKDPARRTQLREEVDQAAAMIEWLRKHCRDFWFTEGNHETRLPRYLAQHAPDLASTHPTMQQLLGIPRSRYVPYMQHMTLGPVSYTHDLGHSGKHALGQTLDAFGHCVVFGHTHRAGTVYDGDVKGDRRFALNVGWGGDVETIDYMHRAKTRAWQLGLGAIEETKARLAFASFIPYIGGQMCLRGQVFGLGRDR